MKKVIVTGGAGFIGCRLVRHLVLDLGWQVLTVDKLTYSGHLANLEAVADHPNHQFHQVDICDGAKIADIMAQFSPDAICHLAAESHVDRSIDAPAEFLRTNVQGTFELLDAAQKYWRSDKNPDFRFLHVSTDEVYGSLGATGLFHETNPYLPNSPYAASKASSDMFVRAWHETYGLPTLTTNCSNNYGPHQFPEKLIPLTISNALEGRPICLYGDGLQVRDWIHVDDHVAGIVAVLNEGSPGETYNIGAHCEKTNRQLVEALLTAIATQTDQSVHALSALIEYVKDRPGHDRRYALDATKLMQHSEWRPAFSFVEGISNTVQWYLDNETWTQSVAQSYQGERLGLGSN